MLEEPAVSVFTWVFYLGLGLCFWSDPLDQLHYFDFIYIQSENYIPCGWKQPKSWAAGVRIASSNRQWERKGFRTAVLDERWWPNTVQWSLSQWHGCSQQWAWPPWYLPEWRWGKEDLAWIQVIAISFKLWLKSLVLCCQSADLEHLKAIFTCIWNLPLCFFPYTSHASVYLESKAIGNPATA